MSAPFAGSYSQSAGPFRAADASGSQGSIRPGARSGGPIPILTPPIGRRPRLALIGGLALATGIIAAVAVMSLSGKRTTDVTPPPVASTSAPIELADNPPGTAPIEAPSGAPAEVAEVEGPSVETQIEAAQAAYAAGDDAKVVELLGPLTYKMQRKAEVFHILFLSYARLAKTGAALEALDRGLRLDPALSRDAKVIEIVRAAALDTNYAQYAIHVLESRMGSTGADILYELAYGELVQKSPYASSRARESLRKREVYDHATPSVQVTLDLRTATSCDDKKILLPKAKEAGDARTLVPLRELKNRTGCGQRFRQDCWPCMRRDLALDTTIQAVERRVKR